MSDMTMMQEMRGPQCPVCHDNWATDDQVMRARWTGVGEFGMCCRCHRLVHSVDDDYKRRWTRWYKKHPA